MKIDHFVNHIVRCNRELIPNCGGRGGDMVSQGVGRLALSTVNCSSKTCAAI
jgi:hypothetical protein